MTTINPKTRSCYAPGEGLTQEKWDRIFGKKEKKADVELINMPKDRAGINDYPLMREQMKTLADYRKFKNPQDRKKINAEFFGREQKYRNNHTLNRG